MNIRERVFDRSTLYSPGNGRDYICTPEGEIFSINGLYCTQDGQQDRYGRFVRIMDVRWTVVTWQDCHMGYNADWTPKKERRLIYSGDAQDEKILAHYGYRMERDSDGYKNIILTEVK